MLDPDGSMQKHRAENNVVLPFSDFDPALTTGLIWRSGRATESGDPRELVEQAQTLL